MAQYHTQNAAGYTQNYTGNPYAPPVYSPFQNAAHVDDAFGYMANMYGPGLVQGVFGPDAFLAHQAPGQALLDQFTAARYQRHGAAAIEAANMAGNAQVAQKLLGGQRVINGGQPITDLDREHANIGARVLNNPIFKQFAASQIGAENLEGIMFGRRGDPTAIAAATNRIGFFRADAAGHGPRMSSESLKQFSQNVYQNLYGEDANLAEMHGFGAVASGEMMETLFQQGRLPQSIGALSAADRVKAISSTKRDDKTMTELARQFGHSELLSRDAAYASASEEEQKIMLADKLPSFKSRLESTFKEVDKFKAKDSRAKSAEEIEQLDGFGLAANALDAKQVSRSLKDYNGAVSAIREIFGDNGNPNAPIQQLIANLQHLTNGAQGNMSAGKVESMVREIRLAARDTNTDLQNLNAIAAEKKAMARGMGLQEVTAEKGLAGDLLRGQAMADAGVFAKPGFGKLNRAEAEARMSAMSTRGDASSVGRALASMNRLVSENPDKYKDTQLAAAMQAYQRGEDKYEYKGKTFNLAEMAGQQGVQGLYNMARESGADDRLFRAYMTDQIGTEEYMKAGYAYKTQRHELQRDLSRAHAGAIVDRMGSDEFKKLKPRGMSDEKFHEESSRLATSFASKMTGIMIDETADMTPEERVKTLEKRGKEELVRYFKSKDGGGLKGAAAERMAEQYFNSFYGNTESARRDTLLATYSETSAISQQRTGVSLEALKQGYSVPALNDATVKEEMNKRRADRFKLASRGTESGVMQRVGDELERLAGDNAGTRTESLKRIFNIASEDSLLQSYAPDMQEGLVAAARMYTQASVTEKQIDTLADAAQKNPDGTEAKQLKIMAGVDPGKKLTADELGALRGAAKMKSADTAAGSTDAERAKNEQQRNRADLIMRGFNTGKAEDVQAAAKAMAQQTLGAGATTAQIEKFATAALAADSTDFEKQMSAAWDGWGGLSDEKKEQARGVAQALRVARDIGGLAGAGLEQTPVDVAKAQKRGTAATNRVAADVGKNIYDALEKNHDKSEYEKLRPKGMSDSQFETQRKQRLRQISLAMSNVAVNMDDTLGKSDEDRALIMASRMTQQLTDQFVMEGMDPETAQAEARKQLTAVLGSDKDAIVRRTNSALKIAEEAKRAHGQGVASVTEKVTADQQAVLDEVGKDPTGAAFATAFADKEKRQQLLTLPAADAVKLFNKMDPAAQKTAMDQIKTALSAPPELVKKMKGLTDDDLANMRRIHAAISESKTGQGVASVTEKVTADQQAVLDEVGKDPTGAALKNALTDPKKRQQLLTLPSADAVKLFNKLDPAAQQDAMTNFSRALQAPAAAKMFYNLSDDDLANTRRIHAAISESKTGAGISSQNITPEQAQQLQRGGHAAYSDNSGPKPPPGVSSQNITPEQAQQLNRGGHAAYGQGVASATEKVTTDQQTVLDEVGKDPTGAALKNALTDPKKRQQLLTLPTADAVKLFNKLDPAAQKEALDQFSDALASPLLAKNWFRLSDDDMANIERIHGAIAESKTGAGVSSQNITPEQARQLNRAGHAPTSNQPMSRSTYAVTRTQQRGAALGEIDRELADIEKRNKNNWWDYNKEDKERRAELMARRRSMAQGGKAAGNAGDIQEFTVHDPFNKMGELPGQSISMREIRGEKEWHVFGGHQDVSERVFVPYNPHYTEEQAAADVERFGTAEEKAEFKRRGGAKKVNFTTQTGEQLQFVEKPHMRLIAEQALLDAQSADPIQSARQRLGELEKKKKTSWWSGEYFDDEKDQARYNYLSDTIAQYDAARPAGGMGGGGGDMNVNGTLTLHGLSEAVLAATGHRMEDTPDGGPSVDMAGGTGANYGK